MKDGAGYQAASGQTVESSAGSAATSQLDVDGGAREKPRTRKAAAPGLSFPRFFTEAGVDPFDEVEWELRSAVIGNERGEVVFEQRDVEIPKFWSQQATNIVVSKYFRGQIGTPRARAQRQAAHRPRRRHDHRRGRARSKYFASEDDLQAFSDDLKHLLVYQKAAFNSPVWFNCGFEKAPQCSACFINSVQDTMESILDAGQAPRACSSSSDRAPARTCRRSARRGSCSPAAAPRRARCRS